MEISLPPPPVEAPELPLSSSSTAEASASSPAKVFSDDEKAELMARWQYTTRDCFDLHEKCESDIATLFRDNITVGRQIKGYFTLMSGSVATFAGCYYYYTAQTRRVWRIRNPQYVQCLFFGRIASAAIAFLAGAACFAPFPIGYPMVYVDNKRRITKIDEVGFASLVIAEKVRLDVLQKEADEAEKKAAASFPSKWWKGTAKKNNSAATPLPPPPAAAAESDKTAPPSKFDFAPHAPLPLPFDESLGFDYLISKLRVLNDKSVAIADEKEEAALQT